MTTSIENTAAHNLHSILDRVLQLGDEIILRGWATVLDAPWDSKEFSKRHSEVVNLLLLTIQQVEALPERARARTERYIPQWWTAVMQPTLNWGDSGRPASKIIQQVSLDHLESTAELISAHLGGTDAAPSGSDLSQLSSQCQEWLDLLGAMGDDEISAGLRAQLTSQIHHLVWLIDNKDLFGGARVSQEASTVAGSLFQATNAISAQPENSSRWKNGLLSFLAACVFFSQAAPLMQESIEAGSGLVKEIASTVEEIRGE
ncbi:hypothetical protein ACFW9S_05225 [Streptomyces anulatus]|uniref:hypothetical protein n=1 Tax=Streptomyces anulatus TaxID=1892 RepID=UPI0036ADF3F2